MNRSKWPRAMPFATVALLPASLAPLASAQAQERALEPFAGLPTAVACRATGPGPDPSESAIREALALDDRDKAKEILAATENEIRLEAEAEPDEIGIQYLYALALGARAEVEGGRTKVRLARGLHGQLEQVLRMDPAHAGAQHLLGRLHAGVMRMDRVTRFIATRLLGGGALAEASWSEARLLLEGAERGDPCVPDHHFELGKLYSERGAPDRAREELLHVLALEITDAREAQVLAKARALLERLEP